MDKRAMKEMGRYLRQKRLAKKLSQVAVAKKFGYQPQFISNWERGASSPPMPVLRKLVEIYEIPQRDILAFLDKLKSDFWRRGLFGNSRNKSSDVS